jgi:hypothetical protein
MPQVLTEDYIKGRSTKDRPYKVFDTYGLYHEIIPNGSKLWRLRLWQGDKERPWKVAGRFTQASQGLRRMAKIANRAAKAENGPLPAAQLAILFPFH